jgi:hypothetical protein
MRTLALARGQQGVPQQQQQQQCVDDTGAQDAFVAGMIYTLSCRLRVLSHATLLIRSLARSLMPYMHTHSRNQGQNTGYKNFDTSHPCRTCCDCFGKPFTSMLASSPWGNQGGIATANQSQRGCLFQHLLPTFQPPQGHTGPPLMPGAYPHPPGPPAQQHPCSGHATWRGTTASLIVDEECEVCRGIGRFLKDCQCWLDVNGRFVIYS